MNASADAQAEASHDATEATTTSTAQKILTARIERRWFAISMRFSRALDLWEQRQAGQAGMWLWRLMARDATERMALEAKANWEVWAGRAQTAPPGRWRTWLMMGGRGAGKTRAGAEWVRTQVTAGARRVALVGPTLSDVREVMIEGPSGLRSVGMADEQPVYSVTRRRLLWPNGAEGFAFSSEDPDSLRGPQFDAAWCDEIAAWAKPDQTWDMLMFGLRLGRHPRAAATTTPKAVSLVRRLLKQAETGRGVVLTRAPTRENAHNLAPGFIEAMEDVYAGSSLGRQELEGELVEDTEGALFTLNMIDAARVRPADVGELERVVVAVDPPASSGAKADACGIVAAGLKDGIVYVLQDATVRRLAPLAWAERAVSVARAWGAGRIIAEGNQGGEMVSEVLRMAGAGGPGDGLRVDLLRARQGKHDRALPVSAAYARGQVRHAGVFRELEDEMCAFGVEGERPSRSPDRMDALVWAVQALINRPVVQPRVVGI